MMSARSTSTGAARSEFSDSMINEVKNWIKECSAYAENYTKRECTDIFCRYWDSIERSPESPIEYMFFLETLLRAIPLYFNSRAPHFEFGYTASLNQDDIFCREVEFTTQHQIGRYRADFAFRCWVGGVQKIIVVECDGHDFHERTPEQARRDRKRDRTFLSMGISVLRFTGAEIVRNRKQCVDEVMAFIATTLKDMRKAEQNAVQKGGE